MAELINSIEEIIENVLTLHNYRNGDQRQRKFHATRIKNGKLFVALKQGSQFLFAPSKFAGYRKNDVFHEQDLDNRDGGRTNQRITELLGEPAPINSTLYQSIDAAFVDYCSERGITPSRHHMARRYWIVSGSVFPEEVAVTNGIFEGALQQITVNRYERSYEARRACVAHYGFDCVVCGFNFTATYGSIGHEYIHVHHVVPMSTIGEEYEVDPVKDLRPVCPNCHAMLHRGTEVLSIEDLQAALRKAQGDVGAAN